MFQTVVGGTGGEAGHSSVINAFYHFFTAGWMKMIICEYKEVKIFNYQRRFLGKDDLLI